MSLPVPSDVRCTLCDRCTVASSQPASGVTIVRTTTAHYSGKARKGTPALVSEWDGSATIIDGTGRFEGVAGDATYKGGRYANGMAVSDVENKMTIGE